MSQEPYVHQPEHDDPSWVPDPEWDRQMEAANPAWCVKHDRWKDARCTRDGCA